MAKSVKYKIYLYGYRPKWNLQENLSRSSYERVAVNF